MSVASISMFTRKRNEARLEFREKRSSVLDKIDELGVELDTIKEEEDDILSGLEEDKPEEEVKNLKDKLRDSRAKRRGIEKDLKALKRKLETFDDELAVALSRIDEEEETTHFNPRPEVEFGNDHDFLQEKDFQQEKVGDKLNEQFEKSQLPTGEGGYVNLEEEVEREKLQETISLQERQDPENGQTRQEGPEQHCKSGVHRDRTDKMLDVMAELLQEQRRGNTSNFVTRQVAGKDLPHFGGNCMEWPAFKAQFDQTTAACKFSDVENLYRLQKALVGKAKDVVQAFLTTPGNVPIIMKTLERQFGRPQYIIQALVTKVREVQSPRDGRPENLITFANAVQTLVVTIENLKRKEYLTNPQLLEELVQKLDSMYRVMWGHEVIRRGISSPTLKDFNDWLETVSEAAQWVAQPPDTKEKKVLIATPTKERNDNQTCRYCKAKGHFLKECKKFKSQQVHERVKWVQDSKLCYACLGPNHSSKNCRYKRECGVNGCKSFHNRLLHQDKKMELPEGVVKDIQIGGVQERDNQKADNFREKFHQFHLTKWDETQCLLRIAPVTIRGPEGEIQTYAMFDEGAQCSLMEESIADQIGLSGPMEPLQLSWTNGKSNYHKESRKVHVTISNADNGSSYVMPSVRTVKNLELPYQSIDMNLFRSKYPYLQFVPGCDLNNVQPSILIGEDNIHLTIPREVIDSGNPREPVASRCKLGWAVHGNVVWAKGITQRYTCHVSVGNDDELHELVKGFFKLESLGVKVSSPKLQSKDEERAYQLLEKTTKKVSENRWETGLLWKKDNIQLPYSYDMALKRLQTIERKLDKDPEMAKWYSEKMDYYLQAGYLRKLTEDEVNVPSKNEWYIPHFAASNPNKPGKLRLVFDAAASSRGTSLNDQLLTGPDLLNSLPGVLMRFRRYAVGIAGDVKEMFHQINICKKDRASQRILWRGSSRVERPDVLQMDVMMFGAACSPCSAQYVMRKNADEWRDVYPEAVAAIHRNIYMDDCLQSEPNEKEAALRVDQINTIQMSGGMEMLKWMSNSPAVLDTIPSERRSPSMVTLDIDLEPTVERILGQYWSPTEDCLTFKINFPKVDHGILNGTKVPTKRQALKLIASLFDPLGAIANYTIRMRILLQDVWRSGIDWDDEIEGALLGKWNVWISELERVVNIKMPRCFSKLIPTCDNLSLHIFTDASIQAYSSCGYLRVACGIKYEVAFLYGKSRVAPLTPMSIPRLELCGAVLGVRMAQFIKEELELKLDSVHYWTDSRTVLCWIRSDARKYKQFVSHRIGEILECSDFNQWAWVPTKENPADAATRESENNLQADNIWLIGPEFLRLSSEDWPKEVPSFTEDSGETRSKAVLLTKQNRLDDVIRIARFSSYRRLVRTTALVFRIANGIKSKQPFFITVEELELAEIYLIKVIQQQHFSEEIVLLKQKRGVGLSSAISKLTPFLDNCGIIRVGSRAERAQVDRDVKYPIILPGKCHLALLILKKAHSDAKHRNKELVLNEVRQKYWILGARPLLRKVMFTCCVCKIWRAKPKQPEMGLLPPERLDYGSRPFTNCGVDLFGPLSVAVRRSTEKRYGMIFTCLTTRAIHLEVVDSLSTDSAIMAIKRMVAVRGKMKTILSDNGTNFKGAANELAKEMKDISFELIGSKLADIGINWKFIPPSSPHMGGCWERLVRSVKLSMHAALEERGMKEKSPTDEVLRTVFAEAVGLVNSRPITTVSDDASDLEALTPNHFLIGSSGLENPFQYLTDNGDLKKKWKLVQRIRDVFWKRWLKEYLPGLAERKKWNRKEEPVKIGDLVFLAESNMPRGHWMRGRIIAVYPGKDGVVRVVDVQTSKGLFRRPVNKCAILEV